MNNTELIIATKLEYRLCRKLIQPLESIQTIVNECCNTLKTSIPKIVFCETLTKDFMAFDLRNELYFIYDSCLMEIQYLYNCIVLSGFNKRDMDKFFYKLFGEELILQNDIPTSMYFVGKYNNLAFSFDNEEFDDRIAIEHLSLQNYFLIGHELTHLSLHDKDSNGIPINYKKFVAAALAGLAEQATTPEKNIEEVLYERAGYFLDAVPSSVHEYFEMLQLSNKFNHFLEECYCDYMGFKMLIEHYEKPGKSTNAIISALNCLITLESIRDDLRDGIEFVKDGGKIAKPPMYFSVLRTQILIFTIEASHLDTAAALDGIYKRSSITDRLMSFIKELPDKKSFALLSDDNLPNISRKKVVDLLIKQLYYISISPDL